MIAVPAGGASALPAKWSDTEAAGAGGAQRDDQFTERSIPSTDRLLRWSAGKAGPEDEALSGYCALFEQTECGHSWEGFGQKEHNVAGYLWRSKFTLCHSLSLSIVLSF